MKLKFRKLFVVHEEKTSSHDNLMKISVFI
jgi:hypothetical protein